MSKICRVHYQYQERNANWLCIICKLKASKLFAHVVWPAGHADKEPQRKMHWERKGGWGWVDLLNKFELRWANSDVLPQLYNLPAVVMWQSTLEIHLRRQIKRFLNFWQQASQLLDLAKFTLNPPTSTYTLNLDINKVWYNPDDINGWYQ